MRKLTVKRPIHAPAKGVVSDGPARKHARLRLWALLGALLLLVAGTWHFGGFAILPRSLARESLAARDFKGAWQYANLASRLSQREPANALLAARIARSQGNGDRFNQELAKAEQWGASPADVRHEHVLAMAQSGELDRVETELIEWLREAGPEAAEISDAYANGLAIAARFDDAMTILDGWRMDFPNDPRPEYRIGRIEEYQERYVEAEASYRRALARSADYFPARFRLGLVLLHQRRAEEAAETFRGCLQMRRPAAAQVELAIALKALGRSEEARPLLRKALDAGPAELAASYQSLDEHPEGFKAAAVYGKLEADAGNFAEAERWLAEALEADPLDVSVRYALATSLRGLEKQAEAERQFERVRIAREAMADAHLLRARIDADPADVEARLLLGKMILENESERKGLFLVRSIFTYDADYRPAHELLSRYFGARAGQEPHYAHLAEYHRKKAAANRPTESTGQVP
jgi:tetratricopeptide (TPR) repeat protein